MPQQPAVTLTSEERMTLETFVHRGKANTRTLTRAHILLKSAEGWSTAELAAAFDVCVRRRSPMCEGVSPKGDWRRSCTTKCSSIGAVPSLAYRPLI